MVNLLDTRPQEPHSKTLRYAVTGVAAFILLSFALWFFVLRFLPEKRVATTFMDAVVAEKFEDAYKIWKASSSYTYDRFLGDWGTKGYYGPIKSYQIERITSPPGSNGGTAVLFQISPESPFPDENDPKSSRTRKVALRIEGKDMSFSFPP
jgi:hypothetical protein